MFDSSINIGLVSIVLSFNDLQNEMSNEMGTLEVLDWRELKPQNYAKKYYRLS